MDFAPLSTSPRLGGWGLILVLIGGGVGCGSSRAGFGTYTSSSGATGGSTSGSSGAGGSSNGGVSVGGSSGGPPDFGFGDASAAIVGDGGDECAPGVGQYIYVISDSNNLYTFDPTKVPSLGAFALVGPVVCPAMAGSNVNSMAIDRHGGAWVNYGSPDGSIYKVTTTAPVTCQATSFAPRQSGFTYELGMGFSSDAPGSTAETLYVSDNDGPGGSGVPGGGKGLAKLDLTTLLLMPIGRYTGANAGYNAELTGTSDAQLFGFFTTTPGDYSPIDKTNGATPPSGASGYPKTLPTVNASTGGYAFSFWGGDFYFYTQSTGPSTTVTHYHTATGIAADVMRDIGFTIVGAGVSTCAPRTGAPMGIAQ